MFGDGLSRGADRRRCWCRAGPRCCTDGASMELGALKRLSSEQHVHRVTGRQPLPHRLSNFAVSLFFQWTRVRRFSALQLPPSVCISEGPASIRMPVVAVAPLSTRDKVSQLSGGLSDLEVGQRSWWHAGGVQLAPCCCQRAGRPFHTHEGRSAESSKKQVCCTPFTFNGERAGVLFEIHAHSHRELETG